MNKKKKTSSKKKNLKLLKKIGRVIYRFFEGIYKIVDKLLITPVSKIILLVGEFLKSNSKVVDRLLGNKMVLIVLSLILAFGVFLIVDNTTEILLNNSADILYKQKVTALYNEEAYVVEGLPATVDITLIGRRADLYLAKQYPSEEVVVDLRDLKAGTHEVNLKYSGSVSSVEYKLDPSVATVVIHEKLSEERTIVKEILYENKLDSKYNISSIAFNREQVYIKGAQYKLEEVAMVKALIDVRNIVNPTVGTTTLKDIPLVAYDANGEKVDVEIVPATVDATIEISSPKKEVTLKVVPEGEVVFGKAIENMTLSTSKITIYGDQEALDNISSIPVKINVDKLEKDTEFNVNISKPNGIRELSVSSVVVKVTLTDINEKTIDGVSIATKNLGDGLVAQAASETDSSISVIVKGTSTNLKSITSDNITASVDLQGLGVGTHTVNVDVTGDDLRLSYTPKTKTVKIIIKEK